MIKEYSFQHYKNKHSLKKFYFYLLFRMLCNDSLTNEGRRQRKCRTNEHKL